MTFIDSIICGDNVTVMKEMPDNCIDLTVTSPPYDNLRTYGGDSWDFEAVARELYRITKQGGVVVWVVGDATIDGDETGASFKQALFFKEIGFRLHDTMIYQKNSCRAYDPRNMRYKQVFEFMFVFSNGKPKTYNPIAEIPCKKQYVIGMTSRKHDGTMRKTHPHKIENNAVQDRFNVWVYDTGFMLSSPDVFAFKHPAIFPEKLAHDHIASWSNEGDTILDPFSGSGTTCKMAKLLNRHWIGIEINPEYIEISNKRLAQGVLDFAS